MSLKQNDTWNEAMYDKYIEEQIDNPNKECEQCGEMTGDVKKRDAGLLCQECFEEMQHDEPDWMIANF